jgi:hypothetical protein
MPGTEVVLTATPPDETTVSAAPDSAGMAMVAAGLAHPMTPGGIESARMCIRYR